MAQPRTLSKYEAADVLTPLVWPLVGDRAIVFDPRPCNVVTTGVTIKYDRTELTMTVDQYELFRVQVLQYIASHYYLKPITRVIPSSELELRIRERILEVFSDQ